jgi:hypothetical protein
MLIFSVVMPHGLVVDTNMQGNILSPSSGLKYLPISLHSITSQKTNVNIFTAVRTSVLTFLKLAFLQ